MLRTVVMTFAIMIPALQTTAFAAGANEAEQRACRHDVARHCRAVMHDSEQRVGQCLIQNAANISQACQQVLRAHGQL